MVEGNTELDVIKQFCHSLGIDVNDKGINLVNYDGISNLTPRKMNHIIQLANAENTPVFIVADNECNSQEKIKKIKSNVSSKFGFYVWDKDFEYDNFGLDKVIKIINKQLAIYEEKITKKEVLNKLKENALIKSIELSYRDKYHNDIYKKISSKKELSIQLLNKRFTQISKTQELGKVFPIENVLRQIFRSYAQWVPG